MPLKLQTPRSKNQINTKSQLSNTKGAERSRAVLVFGIWSFFGFWILVFGVSSRLSDRNRGGASGSI
jgi:hypothetical protein